MKKIRDFFVYIIFGDKKIKFFNHVKNVFKEDIFFLSIHIDFLSILYFLGRWLPFAIAVGITTGVVASLMDIAVVFINGYLSTNIIFLFIFPLIVALITGQVIKNNPEVGGPGIGFAILHLQKKNYIKIKSILLKLFISILTLSGGFIAGREGPSFFLGIGIGEWIGKSYGFGKKFKDTLGLIGGGAFTGALLKAPLGSSIFAMELKNMYDFNYRPFAPMIVASIVSYLTFTFFRGNHAFIQLSSKPIWTLTSIPYIIGMGLFISFVLYIYTISFHFSTKISSIIHANRKPVIGTILAIPVMIGLYMVFNDIDIRWLKSLILSISMLPSSYALS